MADSGIQPRTADRRRGEGHHLKGPKLEIFVAEIFTEIIPVWVGDLGTRPKNSKLGWFRPENRQFVLFSAVGYNAKDFLTL